MEHRVSPVERRRCKRGSAAGGARLSRDIPLPLRYDSQVAKSGTPQHTSDVPDATRRLPRLTSVSTCAVCVAQVDTLVKHREARAVGTRSRGDGVGGIGRVEVCCGLPVRDFGTPYRSGNRVSRDRRAPTRRRPTLAASALRWRNACVREECPAPVPAPAAARRSARDCRTRHRRFTARQVCSPAAPCGWPAAARHSNKVE